MAGDYIDNKFYVGRPFCRGKEHGRSKLYRTANTINDNGDFSNVTKIGGIFFRTE